MRWVIFYLGAIVGIFGMPFVRISMAQDKPAAADKPNVVLIIGDDQGYGDYGFMGHPDIETPNLDYLAKHSLVFRRGYVTAPLCRPSLASIMTGLYPHQHGVVANDVDPKNRAASDAPLQKQFHEHPSLSLIHI